jgi:CubicO group peptidase (beta-lactamase class C family)
MCAGWVEPGFELVKEGFGEVVRNQPGTGTGAAVAVWLGGRWLVNLWGGAADASGFRAWGESALFYGHLVGEIVRRIDGRSIGGFLRDEVCAPLGLDFAIGLGSTDRARAVEITGLDELRVPAADEP